MRGIINKQIRFYYKVVKINEGCNKVEGYLKAEKKYLEDIWEEAQYITSLV